MAIESNGLLSTAEGIIDSNPLISALGAAGAGTVIGLGVGAAIGAAVTRKAKRRKSSSSRKRHRKIKHTKRGWAQDRRRRSKQKWEIAYQKRKKKRSSSSHKRQGKIYYARKTGQPYKILSNGKARFIKGKRRKK